MIRGQTKRKCGADSVYPNEGCGRTWLEINDTIPHTRIDMGYQGIQNAHPHISIRKWVLLRVVHPVEKTSTFSLEDLRKTLSQYVWSVSITGWPYKFRKTFWINNTTLYPWLICDMCAECRFFRSQRTYRFHITLLINPLQKLRVRWVQKTMHSEHTSEVLYS